MNSAVGKTQRNTFKPINILSDITNSKNRASRICPISLHFLPVFLIKALNSAFLRDTHALCTFCMICMP